MRASLSLVTFVVISVQLMAKSSFVDAGPQEPNWANIAFPRSGWSNSDDVLPGEKKKSGEEVLGSLLQSEEARLGDGCYGKTCVHSDQCCKGSVCVDMDSSKAVGSCLPIYAQREGEPCRQDSDCEDGLRCLENVNMAVSRTCRVATRDMRKKQYNDECLTSGECDVAKGLCCQLQRRHRMAPRKVCYYFADPKSCIGVVDPNLARPISYNFNPFFKARLG